MFSPLLARKSSGFARKLPFGKIRGGGGGGASGEYEHYLTFYCTLYRVSQKKRNGGFPVQCELKVLNIFTSLDKATSAEENDT